MPQALQPTRPKTGGMTVGHLFAPPRKSSFAAKLMIRMAKASGDVTYASLKTWCKGHVKDPRSYLYWFVDDYGNKHGMIEVNKNEYGTERFSLTSKGLARVVELES